MTHTLLLVAGGLVFLALSSELLVQLLSGWRLSRAEGALLVALYIGYSLILAMR